MTAWERQKKFRQLVRAETDPHEPSAPVLYFRLSACCWNLKANKEPSRSNRSCTVTAEKESELIFSQGEDPFVKEAEMLKLATRRVSGRWRGSQNRIG